MLAPFQLPLLFLLFLLPLGLAALGKPKQGGWFAWGLGICLVPAWLAWRISPSVQINSRSAIAIGCGLATLAFPRAGARMHWRLVDPLFAFCVLGILISEVATGSAGLFAPVPLLLSWVIPYAMGRRFLASADDAGRFARLMAPLIALTAVVAAFEMVTRVNPYFRLFGRFLVLQEIHGEFLRMGMKRASVNVDFPISFGMIMILVLPWSLLASRLPGRPAWHRWLPAINLGGAACTLSRGPIAMLLLAWAVSIFFRKPRLRRVLGAVGIAGGLFVLFALQPLLDASAEVIGDVSSTTVLVNGRLEAVNSTRQRALMREVYAPVLVDGGTFGFGSEKVLLLPVIYKIPPVLASVESHYILHQLKYGMFGLVTLNLFAAAVVLTLARIAWWPRGPLEDLAGSLVGAQCAVLIVALSVFCNEEAFTIWLFNAGLAGNLMDLYRRQSAELRRADAAGASATRAPAT